MLICVFYSKTEVPYNNALTCIPPEVVSQKHSVERDFRQVGRTSYYGKLANTIHSKLASRYYYYKILDPSSVDVVFNSIW